MEQQSRERSETMWEKQICRLQGQWQKKGGGGDQDVGTESLPLQLMMKTMVRQFVHLQNVKVHSGADLHL